MLYYHFLGGHVLAWLVLVVAVGVLIARRRRSPRAIGMALPVVVALAMAQAYMAIRWTRAPIPHWLNVAMLWFHSGTLLAAVAMLPVAAMADRSRGERDVG